MPSTEQFRFKKNYLMTPGPTPIPESVVSVFAQPIIHHRTPEFQKLFEDVKQGLKEVFQTKQDVMMLTSTGTGAMDAAVSNLFQKGETVITVNGGKFGDRWTKISKAYGLNPIEIFVERGQAVTLDQIQEAYSNHQDVKAILFQAHETSTGVAMPIQEICGFAKKNDLYTIVDGITGVGVFDIPMDQWGIDVLLSGSQKAFMIPPGLAFIALSERAWSKVESNNIEHFYFDLKKERKGLSTNQTAWTPAISLIQGLQTSLAMIQQEGLQNTFARHQLLSQCARNAADALGLERLAKEHPSPALTSIKVPDGVDGKAIPKLMRDHYGVTIAGGQDELAGKIFRISHFGYAGIFDVTTAFSCLELVLDQLGHPVEFGRGVGAALKTFQEGDRK